MNPLNLLPTWLTPEDLIFAMVLIVAAAFFLKEFKLTSRGAWVVLAGFTFLGAILTYRIWQRKQFLDHFKEREKELEDLKVDYKRLKDEARISEEDYQLALKELAAAKRRAATEIAAIHEDLQRRLQENEEKWSNLSEQEFAEHFKALLAEEV